jgi:activator of HSP90 ATPase
MKKKTLVTKTIRQSVEIPATPLQVYEAIVNPVQHSAFTGTKATGRMQVGRTVQAYDGYISARVLALTPGRKIVQAWRTSEWPKGYPPSRLEISLAPSKGGTRLTMVQSAVPAAQVAQFTMGWKDYYWRPLKVYFVTSNAKNN